MNTLLLQVKQLYKIEVIVEVTLAYWSWKKNPSTSKKKIMHKTQHRRKNNRCTDIEGEIKRTNAQAQRDAGMLASRGWGPPPVNRGEEASLGAEKRATLLGEPCTYTFERWG